MHLVDRHRRGGGIGVVFEARRPRQVRGIDDDRRGRGPRLGRERDRVGLERQQLPVRADDLVLVFVAGARARDENLPVAVAAHPHGVAPAVPEIEIADHADAPRVRREHHEGDAVDAVVLHRMRAELVVQLQMVAFAEQMQVEVGQDRRKAIGVLQLDLVVAEARPQLVMRVERLDRTGEQAGIVNARQIVDVACLVEDLHRRRFRQEHAHDALVTFMVPAEIIERVVMTPLDDRARGRRNRPHDCTTLWRFRMRQVPSRGTCSQAGRFINS